ncbi:MAG: polyprenol monophosphomannose synthase, partial [Minisyncoccota bacterium]
MSLVIIIPTYNEKENISRIIDELFIHVPHAQILVVDDNSPDGTSDIVQDLQVDKPHVHLLVRQNKEGLGKAYIHAFKYALETFSPTRIVMMDADLSHQPHYVKSMEENFAPGKVIVGSRYVKGGDTIGWETWRKFLSLYGNLYSRVVTGIPINDLTAGFYMIDVDLLRQINFDSFDSSGYAFQIELKHMLKQVGGDFYELPIVFVNRVGGESKISNHIISEGLIAPWKIRFSSYKKVESIKCSLCGSFVKKWGEKNDHILYQCCKCKLIFVDPIPDSSSVYSSDYFSGAKEGFGYVDYDRDKEPMRGVFEKYLDMCVVYGKKSGLLYDVGAATGFFLNIAQKRGYDVSGVEMSSYAVNIAQKKG